MNTSSLLTLASITGALASLMSLGIAIMLLASWWMVFEKAGLAGWKGLIPFYNMWLLVTKIANQPWWVFVAFFAATLLGGAVRVIPLIGWILGLVIMLVPSVFIGINVAKNFGKDLAFGIGLGFVVLYPVLALSDAKFSPISKPLTI